VFLKSTLSIIPAHQLDPILYRYLNFITGIKNQEESLKRLKRGKKNTFSLFGSTNSREDEGRDEQRIRSQLILDIEAFGKDGQSIGVDLSSCDSFRSLNNLVTAVEGK